MDFTNAVDAFAGFSRCPQGNHHRPALSLSHRNKQPCSVQLSCHLVVQPVQRFPAALYKLRWLQADVDLVSIMARTGFLPQQPPSPTERALISQGSGTAAAVTSSPQPAASTNAARSGNAQQKPVVTASSAGAGLADAASVQRPLAAALPVAAREAARVG